MNPYYQDELVTLYHGDCREITDWLAADVLVTDPPYGIGWRRGLHAARGSAAHAGIANDTDTTVRDEALALWAPRPAAVFGSFDAPVPEGRKQTLVYRKQPDAGVVGSTTGWRRDIEPIYLVGQWPQRNAARSALLTTASRNAGNPSSPAGRHGHPHAKPEDIMAAIIADSPVGKIADPFSGSGTTLVAARLLNRQSVGVEIEERYCEVIAKRLDQGVLDFGGVA